MHGWFVDNPPSPRGMAQETVSILMFFYKMQALRAEVHSTLRVHQIQGIMDVESLSISMVTIVMSVSEPSVHVMVYIDGFHLRSLSDDDKSGSTHFPSNRSDGNVVHGNR